MPNTHTHTRVLVLYLCGGLPLSPLQAEYVEEQGALQDGLQQGQLLLSGGFPSLLQLGLQPLHGLQGTLSICTEKLHVVRV